MAWVQWNERSSERSSERTASSCAQPRLPLPHNKPTRPTFAADADRVSEGLGRAVVREREHKGGDRLEGRDELLALGARVLEEAGQAKA